MQGFKQLGLRLLVNRCVHRLAIAATSVATAALAAASVAAAAESAAAEPAATEPTAAVAAAAVAAAAIAAAAVAAAVAAAAIAAAVGFAPVPEQQRLWMCRPERRVMAEQSEVLHRVCAWQRGRLRRDCPLSGCKVWVRLLDR